MRHPGLALAAVLTAVALPASAKADRVVDYTVDEAAAARDAVEQGIPLAPLPVRGPLHVALEIAPAVDHDVTRVGIACSAWKVHNPLSLLLKRAFAALDRDGAPAATLGPGTDILVRIEKAATLSRCVATGEMVGACITRVSIDGSISRTGAEARSFHVEREETTKAIGACAGLTRGIGLVSRAAVGDMLGKLAAEPFAATSGG